jgi:hypothetical protein
MSDNTRELEKQLRDAHSSIRVAEAALADVKRQRVKISVLSGVGGFLLFAVGGHWFPGYQLDSTAMATSSEHATNAVGEVMAEVCAQRFMTDPAFDAKLEALKNETGDWSKANYIREGVWAQAPDGEKSTHATAQKCVGLIAERLSKEPEKTS